MQMLMTSPNYIPATRRMHVDKEFEQFESIDWYDNEARFYDPLLVRFTTPDPLALSYPSLSPYAYCANNPVCNVDLDGKKVYLYATTLPDAPKILNPATHTFIVVRDAENNVTGYFAYGSEYDNVRGAFGGRLKRREYKQDQQVYKGNDSEHLKKIIEIVPPSGMSETEFDKVVTDVAESFGNNNGITYFLAPSTADMTEGNCNTSTSTILLKSGVSKERINDITKEIPGISCGFSVNARPWTEHEQEEAVKRQQQAEFIYNAVGKP